MKMKKHGVSLMTLIITIVIMSILTGTIIISITNSNTIDNAKDAVKRYTLAEVTQFANIAYGEAVMDKLTNTEEILKFIKAELKEYGIDIAYYKISLNGNKIEVANRESEPWKFKADATGKYEYVTNGDITLALGDTVNYDETNGGTITGLTNVDWRVLGATEDGDLILISSDNVQSLTLSEQEGFILGIDKLNKISREYGYGEGASYARSITVEDINRITGFNPNNVGVYDPEQTGSGTKYGQGEIYEYGNEVTYYWDGDAFPTYEYTLADGTLYSGEDTIAGAHHNGFYYNNTNSPYPHGLIGKKLITTLKSNDYLYTLNEYISLSSNAYKAIKTYNAYWLASQVICPDETGGNFGLFKMMENYCSREWLFYSWYDDSNQTCTNGICPVVILESDIQLTEATDGVWNLT